MLEFSQYLENYLWPNFDPQKVSMIHGSLLSFPLSVEYAVTILTYIPCLAKYSQSEARIAVAYSAVCNG